MAAKTLPSQDVLNQLLRYEKETGKLYWKERPVEFFKDGQQSAAHNAAIWNARFAGKEIVTALPNGHIYTSINKIKMLVHRMIWKMIYGSEPEIIDQKCISEYFPLTRKPLPLARQPNESSIFIPIMVAQRPRKRKLTW